jgi:hypothetical protein
VKEELMGKERKKGKIIKDYFFAKKSVPQPKFRQEKLAKGWRRT